MTTHTYAGRTLDEIKSVAEAATPGPWQIIIDEHTHYLGGRHSERRIFTEWKHPQLGDFAPVVNGSVGIPAEKGGKPIHMVSIEATNAAHIATINPATVLAMAARIEELERERDAARLEGFRLAQKMAEKACTDYAIDRWGLYKGRLPYNGSESGRADNIVQGESNGAEFCAEAIRAMQPPVEWSEPYINSGQLPASNNTDWPHPDGFAGGLMEQQK